MCVFLHTAWSYLESKNVKLRYFAKIKAPNFNNVLNSDQCNPDGDFFVTDFFYMTECWYDFNSKQLSHEKFFQNPFLGCQ